MRFLSVNPASTRPPFVSLGWVPANVTLAQVAALIVPVLAGVAMRGPGAAATLAVALVAALFWEALFALVRRRAMSAHGATTALIVAVMVPDAVPLWQVATAVTMGVVLAEMVFGGRGFGFLNAAAVSLALLLFSFPGVVLVGGSPWIAATSLPGAALLLAVGLIDWRVLVAAGVAFTVALLAQSGALVPLPTASALAFGLVFLACDPVGAASTRTGRWLYGALTGGLIALFGGAESQNGVVFAVLLASIFAPLLDQLVMLHNARWRERRAGRSHG